MCVWAVVSDLPCPPFNIPAGFVCVHVHVQYIAHCQPKLGLCVERTQLCGSINAISTGGRCSDGIEYFRPLIFPATQAFPLHHYNTPSTTKPGAGVETTSTGPEATLRLSSLPIPLRVPILQPHARMQQPLVGLHVHHAYVGKKVGNGR